MTKLWNRTPISARTDGRDETHLLTGPARVEALESVRDRVAHRVHAPLLFDPQRRK